MTNDKVRQNFEALFPKDRYKAVQNTDVIEAAFEGYKLGIKAGRAAERAEIREKLESDSLTLLCIMLDVPQKEEVI
jgi:hypothetical protein